MSSTSTVKCPWCHETFNLLNNLCSKFQAVENGRFAALAQCPGCMQCVLVYVEGYVGIGDQPKHCAVTQWYPSTIPKIDERIPDPFHSELAEAATCLAMGAANACAAMCRRVISWLAINRGADPEWTTGRQLNYLREKGLIEDKLYRAATAVKAFGDQGAHPPATVTMEEAEQVFSITESILDYAIILDQKLQAATRQKQEGQEPSTQKPQAIGSGTNPPRKDSVI